MALFDLKNIKKNVQKSTDGLLKSVSEAAENLPDSVKNINDSAKNINVGDSVREMAEKGQDRLGSLREKGSHMLSDRSKRMSAVKRSAEERTEPDGNQGKILSIKDSLRLIYCLMAADGTISPEEEDTLLEIGRSLDPEFETYSDEIIDNAILEMNSQAADEEEYFDFVRDRASGIIYEAEYTEEGISAKTLLWNLLVMAFSEGDYSANEKRLIRSVARSLQVDSAVALEMEQTLRTLGAINKEEEWLKTANRSYTEIDKHVKELADRRTTIMQGVYALMAD